jgi:hypothetical protein
VGVKLDNVFCGGSLDLTEETFSIVRRWYVLFRGITSGSVWWITSVPNDWNFMQTDVRHVLDPKGTPPPRTQTNHSHIILIRAIFFENPQENCASLY